MLKPRELTTLSMVKKGIDDGWTLVEHLALVHVKRIPSTLELFEFHNILELFDAEEVSSPVKEDDGLIRYLYKKKRRG